jgi:hypothetical protein
MSLYERRERPRADRATAGLLKTERILISPQSAEIRIEGRAAPRQIDFAAVSFAIVSSACGYPKEPRQ